MFKSISLPLHIFLAISLVPNNFTVLLDSYLASCQRTVPASRKVIKS